MAKDKTYTETAFDKLFEEKAVEQYKFDPSRMGRRDRKVVKHLMSYGLEGKSCLDIGPGTGRWLQFFKQNKASYCGAIDISQTSLDRCAHLYDHGQKANVEADQFDFETDSFDVVISFMVLEHLVNPTNYFSEIKRVSKDGALVLITIPNLLSLMSRVRVVLGILPAAVTSDSTHVKYYTIGALNKVLSEFGLQAQLIPTSVSLHPLKTKKWRLPSNNISKSLDDHLLFAIKVNK